jgi:F0F1-type ATP synthase membrane subunit b/b'
MTIAYWTSPAAVRLASAKRVLRAAELGALMSTQDLVAMAQLRADEILADAHHQESELKYRWRAEALNEAQAEVSDALAGIKAQFEAALHDMGTLMADVVTLLVKQLLDDLGDYGAVERRALAIVRRLLDEAPVDLQVSPAMVEPIQTALLAAGLEGEHRVSVSADSSLPPDEIWGMTAHHCVDGRLSAWLASVHQTATAAMSGQDSAR